MKETLPIRLNEIFFSIQGEASHQGQPCIFIRHGVCSLRCTYCDTKYAWSKFENESIGSVYEKIKNYSCKLVNITGGEPLEDPNCVSLIQFLQEHDYKVLLETGGHMDISNVPKETHTILDIKTPGSGEVERNLWSNLDFLKPSDEIKIVITNRNDYEWSKDLLKTKLNGCPNPIWFSPSYSEIDPKDLAEWIIEDSLPVRMQVQLHKTLWPESRGK